MQYHLPPELFHIRRGPWNVYLDPQNFIWVRVNAAGRALLESLRRAAPRPDAGPLRGERDTGEPVPGRSSPCSGNGTPGLSKGEAAHRFLEHLAEVGFLHRGRYVPRSFEVPVPPGPLSLYLHLSYACNLRCIYCYNASPRRRLRAAGRWAPPDLQRVIAEAQALGVRCLVYTGGEPLLEEELFLLSARRAREAGMEVVLLTNGTRITPRNARAIAEVASATNVTLDGPTAPVHEAHRGRGSFARTVRGIRRLREAGASRLIIRPIITRLNRDHLLPLYRFAFEELAVPIQRPEFCLPTGDPSLDPLLLPPETFFEMAGPIRDYLSTLPADRWPPAPETPQETRVEAPEGSPADHPRGARAPASQAPRLNCSLGFGELSLGPGGDCFPCQGLHRAEFRCGDWRLESLAAIWERSPTLESLRGVRVDTLESCCRCPVRYLCGGGCRAVAYTLTGDIRGHERHSCRYLRHLCIDRLFGHSARPLGARPCP